MEALRRGPAPKTKTLAFILRLYDDPQDLQNLDAEIVCVVACRGVPGRPRKTIKPHGKQ